jgi:2-C-methyl-D-erythritol 4-phosphate cytidylyltransferase
MTLSPMISAIIVAAGSSRRMGFDKLSTDLCGQPVIAHSIKAFESCALVSEIIVVTSPERFDLIAQYQTPKVTQIVAGGAERHFSVWNGLEKASPALPLIAVHDGARPLITSAAISQCAEIARATGAATLAHRIVDTLKRATPGGTIAAESVSRTDLWAMETPQIFHREILLGAYQHILATGELVTDEVSAVQALGTEVHLVENHQPNLKITVAADLAQAQAYFAEFNQRSYPV